MTVARRQIFQSALASVAVTVPAMLPGCVLSPAAASILKAAPYVPATDTDLLRLSARFFEVVAEQEQKWQRYLTMDASTPEAKALGEEVDGMYGEWAGSSDACYAIAPSTPAGAAALLSVILARDADYIDDAPMKALRMLCDALTTMVRS